MKDKVVLNEAKYKMYLNENSGWKNTIASQVNEIPLWEEQLSKALDLSNDTTCDNDDKSVGTLFCNQIHAQQQEMEQVNAAIVQQQKRLVKDCEERNKFDIEAFCTQDILRERIKQVEKMYIDLKCNFYNYLSTIS